MNDFKSKMPDLNEITNMASKLFHDMKTSVSEIVDMYKQKRAQETTEPQTKESPKKPTEAKPEEHEE